MSQPAAHPDPAGRGSWPAAIGWAAYLACSWTWCIGMFLPVLLVRDYGLWAWFVFAVPNILGAAAMGWILRPGASERITTQHRLACEAFSIVTIAFQVFFLASLGSRVVTELVGIRPPQAIALLLAAGLLIAAASIIAPRVWSLIIWAASLALLAFAWHHQGAPVPQSQGLIDSADLLFLAPVCIFGFLLCPYLDLTFHHARQRTGTRDSAAAFTIGFGILFAAMIVGTLGYTQPALALLTGGPTPPIDRLVLWLILTHMLIQLGTTIGFHARRLLAQHTSTEHSVRAGLLVGLLVLTALVGVMLWPTDTTRGIGGWEIIYRVFMSFYGLLFPAYIWICMIPTRGFHNAQRKLIVLAAACILAAPFYWMGFMERQSIWLAPGLAVLLIARLLVRGGNSRAATTDPPIIR